MEKNTSEKRTLIPRSVINVKGRIIYNESKRAWNTIKLNNDFMNEFHQLKNRREKFSYEMVFGRTQEEIKEIMKKMLKNKNLMPILMFLYKDE